MSNIDNKYSFELICTFKVNKSRIEYFTVIINIIIHIFKITSFFYIKYFFFFYLSIVKLRWQMNSLIGIDTKDFFLLSVVVSFCRIICTDLIKYKNECN